MNATDLRAASRKSFGRAQNAASAFFFTPASPRPLAALRIGLGLVLILQALLIGPDVLKFYARDGLVQEALVPFFSEPFTPQIAVITRLLAGLGIGEAACIYGLGLAYLASLVMMTAGWRTRGAAVAAWFLHWIFMVSGNSSNYGVEIFAHVFLFYLMFMPAGEALSVDVETGRARERSTPQARLSLRVLQIQLCLTYFSSGIEKAMGHGWWTGDALWQALMLPDYRQYDFGWMSAWPLVPMIGGWATLLIEMGYCVFIWPRPTRRLWIVLVVGMHLGIALFLGLTLFGLIMSTLTMTIFGVPADASEAVARRPRALGRGSPRPRRASRGSATRPGAPGLPA